MFWDPHCSRSLAIKRACGHLCSTVHVLHTVLQKVSWHRKVWLCAKVADSQSKPLSAISIAVSTTVDRAFRTEEACNALLGTSAANKRRSSLAWLRSPTSKAVFNSSKARLRSASTKPLSSAFSKPAGGASLYLLPYRALLGLILKD